MGTSRWPEVDGLVYGGDYNPEQWPPEVWEQDVALMREAGVNLVSVGIFSWALLEPVQGRYDFGWLDRVLDLLHEGGVAVDLATATASPPPWFSLQYPESLPVTADGVRLSWGSRQAYCPSSVDFRRAAPALAGQIARRYGRHPAVRMWHVNNEYGCHVAQCFCAASADAFRGWLQGRYADLDALNAAWGTAFWSQHYSSWAEVIPPRAAPTWRNPTQQLDWWRFCSDELLALFMAERDAVRAESELPVTTNYMLGRFKALDYLAWSPELDLVSNDHYLIGADPEPHVELAMAADLTRCMAGGAPWLLMESSTSAVNWQPRNRAKSPGELRRHALSHVARGADGVMFFQWRQSRAGAEKFHSALVPHAGTDSKVWREVVALGQELRELAAVKGSTVHARTAILWDYQAWWAVELDSHPSADITYLEAVRRTYDALWHSGITVDFVHPGGDLSGYDLLLAPSLYLVPDASAAALAAYVDAGGTLFVQYFSGIVDDNDHVRLGGYPGALRDVLGVRVEEFFPLGAGEQVALSGGGSGSLWTELLSLQGAQAVRTLDSGPLAGVPVLTRHDVGRGAAWYLATTPDAATLMQVLGQVAREAGVEPAAPVPDGVEVVRRGDRLFVLNHTDSAVSVSGARVEAGDVVVVRLD